MLLVKYRNMFNEQQISGEHRVELAVSKTVKSLSVCPGGQAFRLKVRLPTIDLHFIVDEQRGRHDPHLVDGTHPQYRGETPSGKTRPRRQRAADSVPDEHGSFRHECRIAEDMIGVNMRVDDVAHRLRVTARIVKQAGPFARAAAGIDDRDRFVADNEADIGGIALIGRAHHVDVADMDINPGRDDPGDGQWCWQCSPLLRAAVAGVRITINIVPTTMPTKRIAHSDDARKWARENLK